MKPSISNRLVSGFILTVFFMVVFAFYAIKVSQRFLTESFGKHSILLAEETLTRIDASIYARLIDLERYTSDIPFLEGIRASNIAFEAAALTQPEQFAQKDQEWVSPGEEPPFVHEVLNNPLAKNLSRQFVDFYRRKYGYKVFEEILATNRYGALIAATQKTSDYYQADEHWWQAAKADGFFIGDVEYDESVGGHVIPIAVRIEDDAGEFVGVLGAAIGAEVIIREAEIVTKKHATTEVKLLTKNGQLIYATSAFKFLSDASDKEFFRRITDSNGFFLIQQGGRSRLLSYTHSKGFREFRGLQWVLIVAHDVKDLLAPIFALQHQLAVASLTAVLLGLGIALITARSIVKPLARFRDAAKQISEGDWQVQIPVASRDELGELATSFSRMVEQLSKTTVSRDYVDSIIEAMNDALVVIEPDMTIRTVNSATLRLLHYSREELSGKPVTMLFSTGNASAPAEMRELLDRQEMRNEEVSLYTKQGAPIPALLSTATMTNRQGRKLYLVCTARDITERKEAEEALHKAYTNLQDTQQQLIQAAKMDSIGRLAAGAAHEVRNPLAIILMGLDYLENQQPKLTTVDENLHGLVTEMKQAVRRADSIIRGLLDFSAKRELELTPAAIGPVVQNALNLVKHEMDRAHIKVEQRFSAEIPPILLDSAKLEQVFINVFMNAIQAMKKGGMLTIRVSVRPVSAAESELLDPSLTKDSVVAVEVQDTGPGISEEDLPKVFEPFFTRKPAGEGTGLGLAITRTIVSLHKGLIYLENCPEGGAKVTVVFPC